MSLSQDRYRGALLGLAAGDALGTTLEFTRPGRFQPIDDMVGGGPFNLRPGCWTDDTSMALCMAASLVDRGGFDPVDQLQRYVRWWQTGYLSSTGQCFDIGTTTRTALERFQATGESFCGDPDARRAGNGGIMRLAPVVLAYASADDQLALERAQDSSRTTHAAPEALWSARLMATIMRRALRGLSKDQVLGPPLKDGSVWHACPPDTLEVAAGFYKRRGEGMIRGVGYAPRSLEAALWAFYRSHSWREGALLAVNLGEDADTTGAIYGQIAGAFYGANEIPEEWRARLKWREKIERAADLLLELAATLHQQEVAS